jgi:hypothetical protein
MTGGEQFIRRLKGTNAGRQETLRLYKVKINARKDTLNELIGFGAIETRAERTTTQRKSIFL